MTDDFDVIVVGGRCAGSPLGALLARQGMRVAVIERAAFPKDTLSTHIIQAPGINLLHRLGVLDRVMATGPQMCNRVDLRQEDFHCSFTAHRRPGDHGALLSVRRLVLDPILLDAAVDAGAEVMTSTTVIGLVRDGDRVTGVTAGSRDGERALRARLVVGADGRNSTVGELAGARKYNVVPGQRFGYWGFFAGADIVPDMPLVFHKWDGRFVIAMPADDGLYQVILLPDLRFLPDFRRDREAAFAAHIEACAPVAAALAHAQRVGKMFGVLKFESFFRESAGPGWVLVGDAGNFKDPAPGQGMTDAFRQAEVLAPAIAEAIDRPAGDRDAAMAAWARWRDRDAAEHYWLAVDFGAAGSIPEIVVEVNRELARQGRSADMGQVLQHRARPSAVITPPVMMRATAAALRRPGADRRAILRELRTLIAADNRRRRLARRPEFVPIAEYRDAGETEVLEAVAA